jgi:hypothetical protein
MNRITDEFVLSCFRWRRRNELPSVLRTPIIHDTQTSRSTTKKKKSILKLPTKRNDMTSQTIPRGHHPSPPKRRGLVGVLLATTLFENNQTNKREVRVSTWRSNLCSVAPCHTCWQTHWSQWAISFPKSAQQCSTAALPIRLKSKI